jgi:hypothetical protein
VSEVRIEKHELGGEASDAAKLLALPRMRPGLEPQPADERTRLVAAMTAARDLEATLIQLVELIEAIDRRLPQVERAGESAIADAAERLRIEATKRVAEIELELADRESKDARPGVAP